MKWGNKGGSLWKEERPSLSLVLSGGSENYGDHPAWCMVTGLLLCWLAKSKRYYCLLPLRYLHLAKGIQKMLSPCRFRHLSRRKTYQEEDRAKSLYHTGNKGDNFTTSLLLLLQCLLMRMGVCDCHPRNICLGIHSAQEPMSPFTEPVLIGQNSAQLGPSISSLIMKDYLRIITSQDTLHPRPFSRPIDSHTQRILNLLTIFSIQS